MEIVSGCVLHVFETRVFNKICSAFSIQVHTFTVLPFWKGCRIIISGKLQSGTIHSSRVFDKSGARYQYNINKKDQDVLIEMIYLRILNQFAIFGQYSKDDYPIVYKVDIPHACSKDKCIRDFLINP